MRVVVDMKQCEANALCMGIAPDVFQLGDDDVLVVLQERPDPSRRADIEQAVRQCPKQAISIVEED